MEIEKPFKCSTCDAQFTNADHLLVHRRRHEMSLNLKQSSSSASNVDGFTDETPTPTRFFRNCEEVGLFQDLQNVNPFDESFAKAASGSTSGTPSVEPFDFSIALPSALIVPSTSSSSNASGDTSASNKRRYSDQDTLNTPQVFGYLLSSNSSTSTSFSSTTTTVLNPVPCDSDLRLEIDEDSHRISTNGSNTKGYKAKGLKLNLSPGTSFALQSDGKFNISADLTSRDDSGENKRRKIEDKDKKVDTQERNRAAASRSRQRQKQWISTLESRCASLEDRLAETKTALLRERGENQVLREELLKHANCDVTKASQSQSTKGTVDTGPGSTPDLLVNPKQMKNPTSINETTDITPTPNIPRLPAKRGRPRRGQERRTISLIPQPETSNGPVLKIPIPPLHQSPSKKEPDECG